MSLRCRFRSDPSMATDDCVTVGPWRGDCSVARSRIAGNATFQYQVGFSSPWIAGVVWDRWRQSRAW